jgi:dsDNA-specific endonuclease/ATPase MutS2
LAIKKIYELIKDPKKFYENFINNDKEFHKVYDTYEEELKEIEKNISLLRNKNKNLYEELSNFDDREAREDIKNIIS